MRCLSWPLRLISEGELAHPVAPLSPSPAAPQTGSGAQFLLGDPIPDFPHVLEPRAWSREGMAKSWGRDPGWILPPWAVGTGRKLVLRGQREDGLLSFSQTVQLSWPVPSRAFILASSFRQTFDIPTGCGMGQALGVQSTHQPQCPLSIRPQGSLIRTQP